MLHRRQFRSRMCIRTSARTMLTESNSTYNEKEVKSHSICTWTLLKCDALGN